MSNEIDFKINSLINALHIKEQEEKSRYDAAIDIEDMAKAKEVMFDTRTKIQQLRKWAESLVALQNEISNSFLASDNGYEYKNIQPTNAKKEFEVVNSEPVQINEFESNIEVIPNNIHKAQYEKAQLPRIAPLSEEKNLSTDFDEPREASIEESINSSVPAPAEFTLFDKIYSIKDWDEVLLKLCETMILKKPYKTLTIGINQLVKAGGLPVLWFDERAETQNAYKLSNGIFIVKNKTSGEIISYCKRILTLCGYDSNELKIS